MPKSIAWISGWGVDTDRFAEACRNAFPEDQHQVFVPGPDAIAHLLACKADIIGAYSLGTLLLLHSIDQIPTSTEILLLAPITGFCLEHQLGGKTSLASLKMLQSRLDLSPVKALKLFYRLAGLQKEPSEILPYAIETLKWGLTQLEETVVSVDPARKLTILIGEQDPLLEYQDILTQFKDAHSINVGHDYHDLLIAAALDS